MATLQATLQQSPVLLFFIAGVLGLTVGSFLNVVIYRLPIFLERHWRRECRELGVNSAEVPANEASFNLITPRSQCRHCGHRLSALENIPVVSFLWLKGKCRACSGSISWRYPSVELLTGVITISIVWSFGLSTAGIMACLLSWTLIALAFIDIDHQLLPDNITLPLLWGGLIINLFGVFTTINAAVIGAVTGYLSLWLVYQIFRLITGKEGMGYGDFKLFAALGGWLGWSSLPLIILLSSAIGALLGIGGILLWGRDRHLPIPFGPFLCAAGWVTLLWGDAITRYYLQLANF